VHEFRADRDSLFRELPVALLVDGTTSGAAEWVAAAVQDNRAGIVVGEATAGNWEVISAIRLPKIDAALSMRTGIFERPIVPTLQMLRDRERGMDRGEAVADLVRGVVPDRRIARRDREPSTGPFAVEKRFPAGAVPRGPEEHDPILMLAVKIITAKIIEAQSSGD
jgi:hypothetical protein